MLLSNPPAWYFSSLLGTESENYKVQENTVTIHRVLPQIPPENPWWANIIPANLCLVFATPLVKSGLIKENLLIMSLLIKLNNYSYLT